MGYKLANAAYEAGLAGVISDRSRLALDHMCRSARDVANQTTPAAIYTGGYVSLGMHLLGFEKGGSDAGKTAAKRAIRELVDAGLIELVRRSGAGQSAAYRILLGAVDNSAQDPLPGGPTGVTGDPLRGSLVNRTGVTGVSNAGHQRPPTYRRRKTQDI